MTLLKTCPFCGAGGKKIRIWATKDGVPAFVSCRNCGAIGPNLPESCKTEDAAIEVWNRRAGDADDD